MEDNIKITKIIVSKEDEITDIVSGILSAQTERIILTFAEDSDLLISAINLSVIMETAEEEGKLLICQIIKNPTGLRNANLAGIMTIDSPNNPTEDIWEKANIEREKKLAPKTEPKEPVISEPVTEEIKKEVGPSSFEKRVNEAIQKSKLERESRKDPSQLEQDGLVISVGEDLPSGENPQSEEFVDLSKIDFKDINNEVKSPRKNFTFKLPQIFKKKTPSVNDSSIHHTNKLKKLLPIVMISAVFVAALVGIIYFSTVPFVKVRIFVKAQDVSIEKTFTGDTNIKEIDFTNLKIPIKTESIDESRSTTVTATGKAYKGEKAKGSVTLTYAKPDCSGVSPINLPANQVITSADGKAYALDSATTMNCSSYATVAVHAVEIGEEYNTSNSYFTVQGYSTTDLFGLKSGDFTGGSKEEYTVLSLTDVNTAVDSLKASAIEEGEQALKNKEGEWTMITDSLKSDVKADSVKTDVAVGATTNQANVSMSVTSSATYYLNTGFNEGVAALLTAEAQAKNLFQSDKNMDLVLSDNIEKNISVVQNTDNSVLIKLTAKGSVQPKIDKTQIVKDLQSKNWADGTKYLDNLKYSDKATLYEFNPVNFPKSLYYFPKRQGGVLVEIDQI